VAYPKPIGCSAAGPLDGVGEGSLHWGSTKWLRAGL